MIAALLAFVLCWPAVETDCAGAGEVVVSYRVRVGALILEGEDANGNPIYLSTTGPPVDDVPAVPVMDCTAEIPDVPPLGSVYLYDVEARDAAGNDSADCPE